MHGLTHWDIYLKSSNNHTLDPWTSQNLVLPTVFVLTNGCQAISHMTGTIVQILINSFSLLLVILMVTFFIQ